MASLVSTARAQGGSATVVVADDGGLDPQAARGIRMLAGGELRKRGLNVEESTTGASRIFAIRIGGKLGNKIPISVEEQNPGGQGVLFAASLVESSIEESTVVVPRLVDAVLDRKSPEENATIASVSDEETREFKKKPGQFLFGLGLPIGLSGMSGSSFGLSGALGYEIEQIRLDGFLTGVGGDKAGAFLLGLTGNYLFNQGEFSPYAGGGVGYMFTRNGDFSNGGIGGIAEVGVEALRLHWVHAIVGVQALLPFYQQDNQHTLSLVQTEKKQQWNPYFLAVVRITL